MALLEQLWTAAKGSRWLVAGLFSVGFLLGFCVHEKGLFSQETAAWVQGLGSIAAIVGAIWISKQEARREGHRRFHVEIEKLIFVGYVAKQVRDAMRAALTAVYEEKRPSYDVENFDSVMQVLDEIVVPQLPSPKAGIAVVNLRRSTHFFRRQYIDLVNVLERRRLRVDEPESLKLNRDNPFHDTQGFQDAKILMANVELERLRDAVQLHSAEVVDECDRLFGLGPGHYAID